MKITFPVITLCKGGAQRMLAELINGLAEKGHEVTVLMPQYGLLEFHIKARIIRVNDLSENVYNPADAIISNYYTTVSPAQAASSNGKGKHIRLSLCYEPMFLPDQDQSFLSYHATPHLIVLSNYQKQLIQLNHGIEGEIVPVGVGPAFANLHQRKPNDPLTVSAVVRKPEDKGGWHREQEYLIQQLRAVKQDYPHIRIELICPPNELRTSRYLKRLQRTREFNILTPDTDQQLCKYYNRATIFASSSIFEAAALPGLEAMRCGAALACVYSGGNADYARNGETCLLSHRYESRLAFDIKKLIQNPALREKLRHNGEQEALKWTWKRSVDSFESNIQKIVSQ